MVKLPRLVSVAAMAAQLARVSVAATVDVDNDVHVSYLRSRATHNNADTITEPKPNHSALATYTYEDELAATEAILKDYDFTKTLRDTLALKSESASSTSTSRNLLDHDNGDTCLPHQSSCTDHTTNCCQGGCSSNKQCYCQNNGGLCFNFGSTDIFCCSNKCGNDGRCECIAKNESCEVGDGHCCDGLVCGGNGRCIGPNFLDVVTATAASTAASTTTTTTTSATTATTTIATTPEPSPNPTKKPTPASNTVYGFNCKAEGHMCFYFGSTDIFCCSQKCGSNGQCEAEESPSKQPTTPPSPSPTPLPTIPPVPQAQAGAFSSRVGDNGNGNGSSSSSSPDYVLAGEFPSIAGGVLPSSPGSSRFTSINKRGNCNGENPIKLTIEIQADKYGGDVGWLVKPHSSSGSSDDDSNALINISNGTYGIHAYDKHEICVTPGLYNFTVTDMYGDGVCCQTGDGYIKVHLDNREVMHVKSYGKVLSETLNIGFDPNPYMSERDYLYLEAHNSRRAMWFKGNDVSHTPMLYSPAIAEESRVWAEKLLVNCSGAGIEHEPHVSVGENLAKNTGTMNEDGLGWGQVRRNQPRCILWRRCESLILVILPLL